MIRALYDGIEQIATFPIVVPALIYAAYVNALGVVRQWRVVVFAEWLIGYAYCLLHGAAKFMEYPVFFYGLFMSCGIKQLFLHAGKSASNHASVVVVYTVLFIVFVHGIYERKVVARLFTALGAIMIINGADLPAAAIYRANSGIYFWCMYLILLALMNRVRAKFS